ncbi:claudin-7-like [Myiozetetes cayanensis]|uniref:claudin-7-like n=1 Tax=Myiozetetes cayanensis TaxID=478635 RepID=UPI0021605490|nr:claudin-7-like [Myiozetetes cayanensis]
MVHGGLQVLGLALAGAGWAALVAATALPQWEVSSFAGDTLITALVTWKGLWMSCVSQSTGQLQCKSYDSVLALPGHLQATRALLVISGVLGPLALGVAVGGMKCTRCGSEDPRTKAKVAAAGGSLFIVAGLLGLVACSWYGHRIVTNFYDPTVPVNYKFEFGTALFVGWGGAALTLLGGSLLASSCSRCGGGGTTRAYPKARKTPGARSPPSSAREYV